MNSSFVMLCGLPGSGKSTYAKELLYNRRLLEDGVTEGNIDDNHIGVILSSDDIRIANDLAPSDHSVFEILHKLLVKYIGEGCDVIYDATNLSRKNRIYTLNMINKYDVSKQIIVIAEPYDICYKQNKQRSAVVPDSVMYRMLTNFEIPMDCEGWDSIKFIQNNEGKPVEDYLIDCKGFNQDNKHHIYDLFEHQTRAQDYIYEHGNKDDGYDLEELGIAALYHDIGKLITKRFIDSKGNPSKEAHYYGHHNAGAYMWLTSKNGINTRHIAELINWHMRPYLDMKESKKEYERDMLGEVFCKEIDLLHEADIYAH